MGRTDRTDRLGHRRGAGKPASRGLAPVPKPGCGLPCAEITAVNHSSSFSTFIAEIFFLLLFLYMFLFVFLIDIGNLPEGAQKPGRLSADRNAGVNSRLWICLLVFVLFLKGISLKGRGTLTRVVVRKKPRSRRARGPHEPAPSSPGAAVSREKPEGELASAAATLVSPRQVAVYRSEEDATLARREVEGEGNNYVQGEGTGPGQHQALIPVSSSQHLPRAGCELRELSAAVAKGDAALRVMKMTVRPSRPPRQASLL